MPSETAIVPACDVGRLIYSFRDQRVILDRDLASLYGVRTKALNQAVKRNRDRFPFDFMFQLTAEEWATMRSRSATSSVAGNRSQIVTGSSKHRDPLSRPYAFTEQGVAMLSRVLRSPRAVEVNIAIMRGGVRCHQAPDRGRRGAPGEPEAEDRLRHLEWPEGETWLHARTSGSKG